jgi:hypothetical protein
MLAFRGAIKDALKQYCIKIGIIGNIDEIADDLSWMGLQKTDFYLNDSDKPGDDEKSRIEKRWDAERTNTIQYDPYNNIIEVKGEKKCL